MGIGAKNATDNLRELQLYVKQLGRSLNAEEEGVVAPAVPRAGAAVG